MKDNLYLKINTLLDKSGAHISEFRIERANEIQEKGNT